MKLVATKAKTLATVSSQSLLKRMSTLMLIAALCCVSLAGCAQNSDSANTQASNPEATQNADNSNAAPETQATKAEETAVTADEDATEITVTVKVTGEFENTTVDSTGEYTVSSESSALDALQATDLDVTLEDSQYGAYVTSIDGLTAEGSNGWLYEVNGESPAVSAGDYKLTDGDTITWSFYVAE